MPFDASEIEYKENKVGSKVFFYHGLLCPKDKGGPYIKEGMEILRDKYPNDVEICVPDTLTLKEYLEVLSKNNVMVDQCKENCWGMNACYTKCRPDCKTVRVCFGKQSMDSTVG